MEIIRKPFVIVESPFKGDIARNVAYADRLMMDCFERGEVPFLGHLLYTRVFDDSDLVQRRTGIEAHKAVIHRVDYMVVGEDLGMSQGMKEAIDYALQSVVPVKYRRLGDDWMTRYCPLRTPGFQ